MAGQPDLLWVLPNGTIHPGSLASLGNDIPGCLTGSGGAAWPAANLAIYVPVRLDQQLTIKRMVVRNGATANGNMDVGIFDRYGNKIVAKGSTAQSGTSALQFLDITDTTLVPDNYYLYICSSSGTGTYERWSTASALLLEACGVQQEDRGGSAPTAPTTATFANPANAYVPMLAFDFVGTF